MSRSGYRASSACEALERRTLLSLSQLTVITHGLELSAGLPAWERSMEDAIAARSSGDVAELTMTIGSVAALRQRGLIALTSDNGHTLTDATSAVISLDWSAIAGDPFKVSTRQVATAVANYLTSTIGIPELRQSVIHLIGHSRGGSLMAGLAQKFGAKHITVDQLTTLDPRPVVHDFKMNVGRNVVFADSYFQKTSIVNGVYVPGAYNTFLSTGLLTQGGYVDPVGGGHEDVHLWYLGTIDTGDSANEGGLVTVPSGQTWYSGAVGSRQQTGFYYSVIGGGSAARPVQADPEAKKPRVLGSLGGPVTLGQFVGTDDLLDRYEFFMPTSGSGNAVNVQLGGLAGDANLVLWADLNHNRKMNRNELVSASSNSGLQPDQIISALSAVDARGHAIRYYVDVIPGVSSNTNYELDVSLLPVV